MSSINQEPGLHTLPSGAKTLAIQEISTLQGFGDLKDEWNALLSISSSNNLFITWEWLYNWWAVFGYGNELKILLIRENGKLKGIAPLYKTGGRFPAPRKVRFLGSHGVGSDYLDFILYPGAERELISEILMYFRDVDRAWEMFEITDINESSKSVSIISEQKDFKVLIRRQSVCPYLSLPERWEELFKGFSKNMRYDINRKKRKFSKDAANGFVEIVKEEDLPKAIDSLIDLNKKRFEVKEIASPFSSRPFVEFHRKIIPMLFKNGSLRLFFLKSGKAPIACLYTFKYNGKYLYYQIGFDSKWNKFSPGVVLFTYAIQRAINEGMEEFDFLQGDEPYKNRWTSEARQTLRIYLFKKTIKSRLSHLLIISRNHASRLVKGMKKST